MEESEQVEIVLLLLQSPPPTTLTGKEEDEGKPRDRRCLVVSLRRGELIAGVKSVGASIAPAISDEDGPDE
jgi:hypothetical protein